MPEGPVLSWHHTGVVVDDLDAALAFYAGLGYQPVFRPPRLTDLIQRILGMPTVECDLVQCESPASDVRLELLQFSGVPADADGRLPVRPGMSHNAYLVPDVEQAVEQVVAAGGSVLGEVVTFPDCRAAYCATPAGTVVELEEAPDVEAGPSHHLEMP